MYQFVGTNSALGYSCGSSQNYLTATLLEYFDLFKKRSGFKLTSWTNGTASDRSSKEIQLYKRTSLISW